MENKLLAKADLVLFAGQSNMSGRGDAREAAGCDPSAGFEYKPISAPDRLFPIAEPFGLGEDRRGALDDINDEGVSKRRGSMVTAFADAYYRRGGRQIIAVSASKGGSATEPWRNCYVFDAADRLDAARRFMRESGIQIGRCFVVWSQGETDGDRDLSKEEYKQNTAYIFEVLRNHGAECFFIVGTGHFNYIKYPELNGVSGFDIDRRYARIREAQYELCAEYDDIFFAAGFEPHIHEMRDKYHYYQSAYTAVGKTAGETTAKLIAAL